LRRSLWVGMAILVLALAGCSRSELGKAGGPVGLTSSATAMGSTVLGSRRRDVPQPLPGHPGNVFLAGEVIEIPVLPGPARWQVHDHDDGVVARGDIRSGQAVVRPGSMDIGWYRLDLLAAEGETVAHTTFAVVGRLAAPTPQDSPVCLDSATCWFSNSYRFPGDPTESRKRNMDIYANLAGLAGANWIRDRMDWGGMERTRGTFARDTLYDLSVARQASQGLNVLQVFHDTPSWAVDKALDGDDGRVRLRLPRDLRDVYRFGRAMAVRFSGQVLAWEPRNEADLEMFGGHTIDEMCAYQKAAYLGFKRGTPQVTVCWNVFGLPTSLHRDGVLANEAWPYFDTYNTHTYSRPKHYLQQFAAIREGACGRPIWLTECGKPTPYVDGEEPRDPTPAHMRQQAEFIARSYACSLFAGVDRHFFYILGDGPGQSAMSYGLLRQDFTPRPAYPAMAAVGRFLAGAKCIGRATPSVYAFRAWPDGVERDVLVAWGSEGTPCAIPAAATVESVHDFLGRRLAAGLPAENGMRPIFVVMPKGSARSLSLEPPPERSAKRRGRPSAVVLQVSMPRQSTRLTDQAYEIPTGQPSQIPLYVYNFGKEATRGVLQIEDCPPSLVAKLDGAPIHLAPMERRRVLVSVLPRGPARELAAGIQVKIRGDFGTVGRPVVAFRLVVNPSELVPRELIPVPLANDKARWRKHVSKGSTMHCGFANLGALEFGLQYGDTNPWAAPYIDLRESEIPSNAVDGLAYVVQLVEGAARVRTTLAERAGDSIHQYRPDAGTVLAGTKPQRVIQRFRDCPWVAFLSTPDPAKSRDDRVRPERIFRIYLNVGHTPGHDRVRVIVRDFEWIVF